MSASWSAGPEWILEATSGAEEPLTQLTESAKRIWPRLRSFARHALPSETPSDEKDRFLTEVFESVLLTTREALGKSGERVLDLDAYLSASFRNELARRAKKEKRLRDMVQYMSSGELDLLPEQHSGCSSLSIEDLLQVQQITQEMDAWTRVVWVALTYGKSWKEIGHSLKTDPEQAKQKFRYAIKKIRDRLNGPRIKSPTESRP